MTTERETLPSKIKVSAVTAEMMIRKDVDLQGFYEATGVEITDEIVQCICESNSSLLTLKLNSCRMLSDFSLVSIGRCCKNLKSISLGGCINVGHVGLRSLAMHCRLLQSIDFVGYHIDDAGLRIIAASLNQLVSLNLNGCTSITDRGLSQVAHCCTKLRILKLGGCYKIGESGVWAFYELENCQELEEIELCGCIYLSNSALVAISKRCPSLRKINISECPGINGKGITKLISYGNNLVNFVASWCPQAIDDEVVSNIITNSHKRLVELDISYCKISGDVAIQISTCCNLKCLKLSGCQINDKVIEEYSKNLSKLESLEVFESDIANRSVELLLPGEGGSGLSYFGLTGCSKVDEVFLRQVESRFKFSILTITETFVGFVPRKSEQELRKSAQIFYDKSVASVLIQKFVRGMMVRIGIYKRRREERVVNYGFLQLQALYRANRSRTATKELLIHRVETKAATYIASSFKRFRDMKDYKKYLMEKAEKERCILASKVIQTHYRGHCAKMDLIALKNKKIENELKAIKERDRKNKAIIIIQKAVRSLFARRIVKKLAKQKLEYQELTKRKLLSTMLIQRVYRGHRGRVKANILQSRVHRLEEEWFCARQIQCSWRGMIGRREYRKQARLHEFKLNQDKAKLIQKVWRGCLDRNRVSFLRALHNLNKKEIEAALFIQRIYRGSVGRHEAFVENKSIRHKIEKLKASKTIQRVYRGYKGREHAQITIGLNSIRSETDPLFKAINAREECRDEQIEKDEEMRQKIGDLEGEISGLQNELDVTSETKSRFVDSSIISGAPQRCAKEVVLAALKKSIDCKKEQLREVKLISDEISQMEKEASKEIYKLKKQLSALTSSVTNEIKAKRLERFKKN